MKLTESMNICYVSLRLSCTIKVNVKETFMGNDPFHKCLFGECFVVREGKGRIPATMGNP